MLRPGGYVVARCDQRDIRIPCLRLNPYQGRGHAIAGFVHPEYPSCRYVTVTRCTSGDLTAFAWVGTG